MFSTVSLLSIRLFNPMRMGDSKRKSRSFLFLPMIMGLILLLTSTVLSQTKKGTYGYPFRPDSSYVSQLLNLLRSEDQITDVMKYFFGEHILYDSNLADLIVFIDKTKRTSDISNLQDLNDASSTHIALVKNGKREDHLFGEKYVYVMVFVAEEKGKKPSVSDPVEEKETSKTTTSTVPEETPPDTSSLKERFERTSEIVVEQKPAIPADEKDQKSIITKEIIDYKKREPVLVHQASLNHTQGSGEFFVSSLVRTIAAIFAKAQVEKADKPATGVDMADKPISFYEIGTVGKTILYWGYAKLPIYENTINRLTVQEDYGTVQKDCCTYKKGDKYIQYRHQATFGNYSASRITSSIGIMGTVNSAAAPTDKRMPVNPFLFGHCYLKRPELPAPHYQGHPLKMLYKRMSISLVAGTRISTDLFDDLFLGACLGHFFSSTGLVVGFNFQTPRDAGGAATGGNRIMRFCTGLTFIF